MKMNLKMILSHFENRDPLISLIVKFKEKTNRPKFGIKNALIRYFWAKISKTYCDI